jgi:predicted DNA-binding protein YlxM (UPF0122 family)
VKKILLIAELLDNYSLLLTAKQREFMRLYYDEDLSLGEIASEYKISRQAVYDILRRAEGLLLEWEEKVGLGAYQRRLWKYLTEALKLLELAENKMEDEEIKELLREVGQILMKMQKG